MERIIKAITAFNAMKFINPSKIFDFNKIQTRKEESYEPFLEHPRPRSSVKFKCNPIASSREPDLKSIVLLLENESGDMGEEIINSKSQWNGNEILNIIIEKDGNLVLILDDKRLILHKNDTITRDDKRVTILDYVSLLQEFSTDELEAIVEHESEGSLFDFQEIVARYNISNFGALIQVIQSKIDAGLVQRDISLSNDASKEGLTMCFLENVCAEYTPLVYHEFQVPLIEHLFDGIKNKDVVILKRKVLESQYYSFDQVKTDFLEQTKDISKATQSDFLVKLRKIISGASMVEYPGQGSYWHPAWFDEDFASKWHVKLASLVDKIIEEHFPLVYDRSLHGFVEYLLDVNILKEHLADHFADLEHLFKLPILNLVVRDPVMRWDWVNPSFFYDGVLMMEGKENISNAEDFDVMGLKTRYVAYSIAIHPLQLLCAEEPVFGWTELAMQTLHHELVHVLQMRFVQNAMTGLYLKNPGMKKTRSIKQNLSYLDALRDKINIDDVLELINQANERLYIREFVPASESKKMNLEDYVNSKGGHTDAFLDVVKSFKHCKIAWKQRRAFLEFIQAFAHRTTGKNFRNGFIFICKD